MKYWWVNQNQTFRQEIEGDYLWSPKRNKNGRRNPFYEFSRVERDSPAPEQDIEEWGRRVETSITGDTAIRETERAALVQARRGQGIFRDNVRSVERVCRIR